MFPYLLSIDCVFRRKSSDGDHYELLIRMVDEEGKLVQPMAFIPAAERYNLMPALDRWGIENSFQQFEQMYGAACGKKLHTAAINIVGVSLSNDGICDCQG